MPDTVLRDKNSFMKMINCSPAIFEVIFYWERKTINIQANNSIITF